MKKLYVIEQMSSNGQYEPLPDGECTTIKQARKCVKALEKDGFQELRIMRETIEDNFVIDRECVD